MSSVTLKNRDVLADFERLQDRLDSGEIVYLTTQMNPFQNMSLDPRIVRHETDEELKMQNEKVLNSLRLHYGEENVMSSFYVCGPNERVVRMPGLLGIYVSGVAYEMVNYLAALPLTSEAEQLPSPA